MVESKQATSQPSAFKTDILVDHPSRKVCSTNSKITEHIFINWSPGSLLQLYYRAKSVQNVGPTAEHDESINQLLERGREKKLKRSFEREEKMSSKHKYQTGIWNKWSARTRWRIQYLKKNEELQSRERNQGGWGERKGTKAEVQDIYSVDRGWAAGS